MIQLNSRAVPSILAIILAFVCQGCGNRNWQPISHSAPNALIPFQEYRMPNGLRVILAPETNTAVVAVDVTYNAGSRDEAPGKTGLAHFCEHMMFKGSERVAASKLLERSNRRDSSRDAYRRLSRRCEIPCRR